MVKFQKPHRRNQINPEERGLGIFTAAGGVTSIG